MGRCWAIALAGAGHQVRVLIADDGTQPSEALAVERVVCSANDSAADLPFDLPEFSTAPGPHKRLSFGDLSDRQLASYRDRLRRRLDELIDRFDPQVIHAQHIWVQGQLALESGVPYVLNAWGPELAEINGNARLADLANQAAENAGRILVGDVARAAEFAAAFNSVAERMMPMPAELSASGPFDATAGCKRLVELYEGVLVERFGRIP